MSPLGGGTISRRSVLASSLLATACRGHLDEPGDAAARLPITDAHVHLFNASDLPIAGFIKHVYLPGHVPGWPSWADALVDMFASFYKPLAISARTELTRLQSRSSPAEPSPRAFSQLAARFIEGRTAERSAADGSLGQSYAALSAEMREEPAFRRSAPATSQSLRAALEAAARDARDGTVTEDPSGLRSGGGARLRQLVGWGYTMVLSRGRHLRDYASGYGSADARPRILFSLLVDYDNWLDDAPATESGHLDQIAVQNVIGVANAEAARVHLFAGYCPLRHAIETARGATSHFSRLVEEKAANRITGYKVYPPMGFRPWNNAALNDASFHPPTTGRRTGLDKWREVAAGPLGGALDQALATFYQHCAAVRAPIIAHAGPGNEAGPGYGSRADPRLWEPVVRRFAVRLSLGHLVNDAAPFIEAVRLGPPYPDDVWSLNGSLRMLDRRSADAPDVYGDLAYMPELTDSKALARDFFSALRTAFGPGDPGLTRIMFGSDWLMAGIEPGNQRFLGAVEAGMADAGYTAEQRDNILFRNAERFIAG